MISVVIVKLIFDFNSATVFGQGNMVLICHFLSGLRVQLWCI